MKHVDEDDIASCGRGTPVAAGAAAAPDADMLDAAAGAAAAHKAGKQDGGAAGAEARRKARAGRPGGGTPATQPSLLAPSELSGMRPRALISISVLPCLARATAAACPDLCVARCALRRCSPAAWCCLRADACFHARCGADGRTAEGGGA